ncbi:growth factor receptor-bound protein 14 isoform X2 [Nomia melanderi]|uniref:growth factor receptor-bound protein 14 isoform X2 n=1 Tax=Nomia melanderi TaxID=2448451 RepID=UPI003FCD5CEA
MLGNVKSSDMLQSLTFVGANRFDDDSRDRANVSDRLSTGQCDLQGAQLPGRTEKPRGSNGASRNVTMTTATSTSTSTAAQATTPTETPTSTAREQESAVATDERPIYSEWFLASCAELASYGEQSHDRGNTATTWLFQVRRRCSNICNWLPKVCSCLENGVAIPRFSGRSVTRVGSYERFGSLGTDVLEFGRAIPSTAGTATAKACATNGHRCDDSNGVGRVMELHFHNDDDTWCSLLVEDKLRADDACRLLKTKRSVSGVAWSIVEEWPELGIERTLEDHEDVAAVHRDMKVFAARFRSKFLFRMDYLKYEFFVDPKQFFPSDMATFPIADVTVNDGGTLIDEESALRNYLLQDNAQCPQVLSLAWVRNGYFDAWRKMYLLLRNRKLYVAKKMNVLSKKQLPDSEQLTTFAHLSDFVVYKITNAKWRFHAPFEWGLCLKPSSNEETKSTVAGEPGLKVVAFQTEKSRVCWLTAMRLAKYGKQLRDNYRAFKNKQCEQAGGDAMKERYSTYNASNESVRSRVAMDFTGSVGRIVEDPKEAKDIAESEGIDWRRTWRPFSRPPPGCAMVRLHGLDDGVHVLQPWFHRGLKRDIAAAIVRDHGSVDGVFLVRESKSNLGAYVLTYKYSDKVFHAQIQPVFDERCNCWLYTLDKGVTKFYDLLQLIAFYQLNAGSLPTRLTHYVQNVVPVSLPGSEREASSSPPSPTSPAEMTRRFSVTGNPERFAGHGTIRG